MAWGDAADMRASERESQREGGAGGSPWSWPRSLTPQRSHRSDEEMNARRERRVPSSRTEDLAEWDLGTGISESQALFLPTCPAGP